MGQPTSFALQADSSPPSHQGSPHIHISPPFQASLPARSPQSIKESSLCHRVCSKHSLLTHSSITNNTFLAKYFWRRKWQPTPVFLTGEIWQATVHRVTKGQTRLSSLAAAAKYFLIVSLKWHTSSFSVTLLFLLLS